MRVAISPNTLAISPPVVATPAQANGLQHNPSYAENVPYPQSVAVFLYPVAANCGWLLKIITVHVTLPPI
ncbi:hypothetical protein LZG54_02690 [Acinetobacter towneri]|nr:hypothetical protein LZG54_02690 [Acinetobacter towneri]